MDASSRPRLRLFRRSPSPRMPDGGAETTPQPAPSSTRSLLTIHDEEDEFPTPRIHPKPIVPLNPDPTPGSTTDATPIPAETPAARLRALLAREPRSPRNTTPVFPPAPLSEADSAAEPAHFSSSTSSVTRETLKDIFSRALREPGDTPRKGRLRRNSFDGSSMEITPVVDRDRGQRRAARRSLSDEEAEKPKYNRKPDPSFRLSTAVTFDSLRARLVSSQSQLMDQDLPEAFVDYTSLAPTSNPDSPRYHRAPTSSQIGSTHTAPLVSTITPHPSFQMSSRLALQSNLLEEDSEMQRAIGNVLNSENEASTSAPNAAQSTSISSDLRSSSPPIRSKDVPKPRHRRTSHEFNSITTNSFMNGGTDRVDRFEGGEYNQREREWDRPRLPSSSGAPDIHRRHSQEFRPASHTKALPHESIISQSSGTGPMHRHLQRRGSLASLRSLDGDHSSRPSSIGSQADHQDRMSELEQERNHEREREWNRRHPPSRPSSSLSTSSNQSFSHTHSHPTRSPTAATHLAPTHASLQRNSSRTSLRSDSPASLASSHGSSMEREQEEKKEIAHERERNWNSARPHWLISKSPSPSHVKIRNKNNNSLRATSGPTHLGDSNGHRDASWVSTKQQTAVDYSSATSPALLHKSGDRSPADSRFDKSAIGTTQSMSSNGLSPTPGAASKFGWNFARSPLPPLELDDPADRRTSTFPPTPDLSSRASNKATEAIMSSQIPVRSRVKSFSHVAHATSDMSLTHVVGDESRDYQNGLSEVVEPRSHGEFLVARNSWGQEGMVPASDEDSINELPPQSTTPKSNPPNPVPEEIETDAETEVLTSPSPRSSPQLEPPASISNAVSPQKVNNPPRPRTSSPSLEELSLSATPPDTPPLVGGRLPTSETSPSFVLITPPRQTSFGSSVFDFSTPSPPHDLPDLPGPPLSSDDDALGDTPLKDRHVDGGSSFTLTKTPKPPGAWVATPLPPNPGYGPSSLATSFPLESTPPAFTSTPLPHANSYHPASTATKTDDPNEDGLLTPVGTLSRAKSLPLRTPAPPGAWMTTLGQSALLGNGVDQSQYASGSLGRRKGLLKVRFDVTESETSATEGRPDSPTSAIRLANPDPPLPRPTADCRTDNEIEVDVNEVSQPTSTSTAPHRSATPEQPTAPISRENGPSPRSFRRSPAVRLVDAYGRERVGAEGTAELSTDLPNGYADAEKKTTPSPPTSRRSLVRIVDAMGREVDAATKIPDASEGRAKGSLEADISVDDAPVGHAEALARMRKALRDLAEGLSDTDRSEDLELDSGHLEQLEEVSKAARLARNQLAHNLHLETAKHHDLHRGNKFPAWTRGLLPGKSWNATIIYCSVIIQLFFFLAMWRYAHVEAHRLFYTIYYDPLYPEFTPIQDSSCTGDTLFTSSRSWTMLDSYETIRREGWWSVRKEILRAMKHVGDQAWECWGESAHFEKPT